MRRFAVAALLLAASASGAAAQTRLEVGYSVYLTGIPIGRGSVTLDLNETDFVVSGSVRSSGLIRLISKGDASANVKGSLKANHVTSSVFSGRYNSSRREQKIELHVVNGFAKEVSIEPPHLDPENRRVPITKESRTNVVDPLSAALLLVPAKGDALSPESCNRTLPIFDGRYRFDVVLSFLRTEKIRRNADGYQGPVLVCQARYIPIAGHHAGGATAQQMAANRDIFVWLAPVSGSRLLIPVKASVSTPMGTFVAEATRFNASQR